jgi:hypothetical protein
VREVTYYRASALLPLALPLFLLAGDALLQLWFGAYVPAGRLGTLLGGSLWLAGLPYALFAAVSLFFLRHQSSTAYRRAAFAAPVLFIPFLWFTFLCVSLASSELTLREQLAQTPASLGYLALLVLPLGYAYVAIVLVVSAALSRLGAFERIGP